ncbi:MAG TPA: hypothetical protein VFX39_04655, partial [Gemmatimonadaceae bacterium]|nr:hypothetical protein [Gemmatimonadaceae bacterium]
MARTMAGVVARVMAYGRTARRRRAALALCAATLGAATLGACVAADRPPAGAVGAPAPAYAATTLDG